jgi:transposase
VQAFQQKIAALSPEKLVYADESGMGDDERPAYGWSEKGTPCMGKKPGLAREKLNIIAGLCQKKIIAPLVYSMNTTATVVETWFRECLLPVLSEGMVIVLDNAPFHRKKVLEQIAETAKCSILWLPPYSPDQNDIEPWWAVIKRKIRKALQIQKTMALYDAAAHAFSEIP